MLSAQVFSGVKVLSPLKREAPLKPPGPELISFLERQQLLPNLYG